MDSFENLLDGDRREELQDFVERYERGAAYDDISEEEAVSRYRKVVPELSGEDYRDAAREALSRMEPEERSELGRQLLDRSLQQGYELPGHDTDCDDKERFKDPDYLARIVGQMRREQRDLLEGLIFDGGAGFVGGMMGEGMTGGEGASGDGGMLGGPIAKSALAGIAAMGARKLMKSG